MEIDLLSLESLRWLRAKSQKMIRHEVYSIHEVC